MKDVEIEIKPDRARILDDKGRQYNQQYRRNGKRGPKTDAGKKHGHPDRPDQKDNNQPVDKHGTGIIAFFPLKFHTANRAGFVHFENAVKHFSIKAFRALLF